MRPGSARNCLNFRYVQNSKVRLPLMKPVERIVIGADVLRQTRTSYRLNIRQSAKPSTAPRWIPNPMIRRVY